MNYRLAVEFDSMQLLIALRRSDRARVLNWIERLRNSPFSKGQANVMDSAGREIQVSVVSSFRVFYWSDHAVKTVQVVKIELNS